MCVKVVDEMNGKLVEVYKKWYDELSKNASQLLGDNYSNPYYIGVPVDWTENALKIMIVGKEGYGHWGCGKNDPKIDPCTDEGIKKIQACNLAYLGRQLDNKDNPQESNFLHFNSSWFWERIRSLRNLDESISFIWNNMDKIHRIPKNSGESCVLGKKIRRELHNIDCHILQEEIKITQPNIVIFFGNYWDKNDGALCRELKGVSEELNRGWKEIYAPCWKKYHIVSFELDGISYVFTYHPGCRKCPKGYAKKQDYEKAVVDTVKGILHQAAHNISQ